MPSDQTLLQHISALVDEEHRLRDDAQADADTKHQRLRELEEQLDQCWDLLRQRRARREFGDDPDAAQPRDVGTVERYIG